MLAIAGGKGGCGKTTTALGLGAALPGQPVVVDADWDLPNLHRLAARYAAWGETSGGGHGSDDDAATSGAVCGSGESARNSGTALAVDRLGIDGLGGVAVVAPPSTPSEYDVAEWLHRAEAFEREGAELDYRPSMEAEQPSAPGSRVLVDCPGGASPDATAPLSVADATLLVTTPEPEAVRDTMKTAAMARALGADPVGTVVVGTGSPPDGIEPALDVPVAGAIPAVDPPVLAQHEVASAYRTVVRRIPDARRTQPTNS